MEEEERQDIFQTPTQFETRSASKNGSGAKRYLIILISIIVVGLLIFGVGRFFTGGDNTATDLGQTPTEEAFPTDIFTEPTDEPTPTEGEEEEKPTTAPSPTKAASSDSEDEDSGLDRADLSIHVLNGNGVSGSSRKVADYLEGLGYNVIQVGNAENFDFEQTEIQIKSASSKYLTLLKSDLSKNYTVGSTNGTPAADVRADAVVIVGAE